MNLRGQYVQFSKIFVTVVAIAYFLQVGVTIFMVCMHPESSSAMVDILEITTGFMVVAFGCYSGNSAVEKVALKNKKNASAGATGTSTLGGNVG